MRWEGLCQHVMELFVVLTLFWTVSLVDREVCTGWLRPLVLGTLLGVVLLVVFPEEFQFFGHVLYAT